MLTAVLPFLTRFLAVLALALVLAEAAYLDRAARPDDGHQREAQQRYQN